MAKRRWWLEPELNRRHKDFQSSALPTELSSHPNNRANAKPLYDFARLNANDGKPYDYPLTTSKLYLKPSPERKPLKNCGGEATSCMSVP
jgi:hypothetical protein